MGLCGGGRQRGWIEDELGGLQARGRRVIREWVGLFVCI
jgi:hypothetical protein